MRAVMLSVLLAAPVHGMLLTEQYVRANTPSLWESFKRTHGKSYATPAEEGERRAYFVENMLDAAREQVRNPNATFGMTHLSDLSKAEFGRRLGLRPSPRNNSIPDIFSAAEVQASAGAVDWRTKGAVTDVKDQGDCGGCWSFSTTGNIEGVWAIAGNTLTPLSEEELLECDDYFPCMGCSSGQLSCAFDFLKSEHKGNIATEKSYPYTSGAKGGPTGKCKGSGTTGATIKGYKSLPSSESQMATWLSAHGPISIGAYATQWLSYKGGIMTSCDNHDPNHAILIVGMGSDGGQDYWIIKNSWGPKWGESGYIRLAKGKDLCKITSEPTTATM